VQTAAALLMITTQIPLKGTCWASRVVFCEAEPLVTLNSGPALIYTLPLPPNRPSCASTHLIEQPLGHDLPGAPPRPEVSSSYGERRRWELFSPACTMHATYCERLRQRRGYPGLSLARVRLTTCCVDVTMVGDKWSIVEVSARFLY
jgi:hypothetical protein